MKRVFKYDTTLVAPSEYYIADLRPDNQYNSIYYIKGLTSAKDVFDFVIPFYMHGDVFYLGIKRTNGFAKRNQHTYRFDVVHKQTGIPFTANHILSADINIKKALSERDQWALMNIIDSLFYYTDISKMSIISYLQFKDEVKNIKVNLFNRKEKGIMHPLKPDYSATAEEVINLREKVEIDEYIISDRGMYITASEIYKLLKILTEDFTVLPSEMKKVTGSILLGAIAAFPYSESKIPRNTDFDVFYKYCGDKGHGAFVYNVDTLLFLYILEFLSLTNRKSEYNKYLHIADVKGVKNIISGKFAVYNKKLNVFYPIRFEDKDIKYRYINGVQYGFITQMNPQEEMKYRIKKKKNNYSYNEMYVFLPDTVNVPLYKIYSRFLSFDNFYTTEKEIKSKLNFMANILSKKLNDKYEDVKI